MVWFKEMFINLAITVLLACTNTRDQLNFHIWGPGLQPDAVVTPVRYFFMHAIDNLDQRLSVSPGEIFLVQIEGTSSLGKCRYSLNSIDRGDGSFIIRYKILEICQNLKILITLNNTHVGGSPYEIRRSVYSEMCYCPRELETFLRNNECSAFENRINSDLQPFKQTNFSAIRDSLLRTYNMPGSISLCNYVVKNNVIYRKCYGKYTGFKMFMDATLLSMTRLVELPDMEFFLNLGDWPLVKKGGQSRNNLAYPIFSWCGSEDSLDIVLPSYDLMESTLENMGRVVLDILSVQRAKYSWSEKEPKAFWRGRDSRRERLKLIEIARKNHDLINASITNFFFFRDEEHIYGPKVAHISFLDFFKYKYQLNIDGTVAAYRLPFLLAGNSLLMKQDSPFYEHFYDKLEPNIHFIPLKRDLSDVIEKVQWAIQNEEEVKKILHHARKFVQDNLLPTHVYCYHVLLFKEWSERIVSPIKVYPDMDKVEQDYKCNCQSKGKINIRDEL